jgi:hypothetical protein
VGNSPLAAVSHCCALSQRLTQQRLVGWGMRNVSHLQQQQQRRRQQKWVQTHCMLQGCS